MLSIVESIVLWKMSTTEQAPTPFSLSAVAAEIRKICPLKYEKKYDDYLCIAAFATDIIPFITITNIDQQVLSDAGPLTKALLERLFDARKKLIQRNTTEAELQYSELKARMAELAKTEPELQQMKDLPNSETSTAFTLIKTVDALRSAINAYYKVKAEEEGGKAYFEKLGDIVFNAIKCISSGVSIPVDIFYGDLMFLKVPMTKLADMLSRNQTGELRNELEIIFKTLRAGAILPEALFGGQLLFLKESMDKLLVMFASVRSETQQELLTRFDNIVRLLFAREQFPQGIFTEETSFLQEPLLKLSKLFMAVKQTIRQELVNRFNTMMRSLLGCFVLYRFPVLISRSQKPVYFSRFIPAIKLLPFLELYGLELGSFTLSP